MNQSLGDRRTYLGASEVAVALGYSPWQTRHELWAYKTGRAPAKRQTPQMERGHDLEPVISKLYTSKTGRPVLAEQVEFIHPDLPWLRYHADGTTFRGEGPQAQAGLLEFKAPDPEVVRGYLDAGLPDDYVFQLQTGMLLAGLPWIGVAVYDYRGHSVVSFDVEANPEFQKNIIKGCKEFWRYVETGEVPPDQADHIDIPSVDGKLRALTGAAYEALAETLTIARSSKLMAEADEERVIAEIKRVMEQHGAGLIQLGRNVRVSWNPGSPRVSYDGDKLLRWVEELASAAREGEWDVVHQRLSVFSGHDFKNVTVQRKFLPTFYGEAKQEVENARK